MELLARGGVVHGGTFNAQPVCMAAAIATLNALTDAHYVASFAEGVRLRAGVAAALAEAGVKAQVTGFELVFHVAFGLEGRRRWTGAIWRAPTVTPTRASPMRCWCAACARWKPRVVRSRRRIAAR